MDAGCPSAEPVAKGKIEPVDWDVCEKVYQARQKLEYINCAIKAEKAACDKRVGSNQLFVYQRPAVMCVTHEDISKMTQVGGPCAGAAPYG